ncbi:M56 family metallopeptidase [Aminipila terrae]|uniref:Peptidase M56 domain-containing protein n=1 Tax=Aminipila terrae TaxID=2697030 RepID=A0A6P1MJF5_9FIRM|nr:M56 family metallopeptidase [Aminipila terrae]QHI72138.1 hypothetical protein Ami3637_06735 [Aminipila terrae]
MINTLFYNTLLTGGIISVFIAVAFLISPLLNKWYQVTWRLNIWRVLMVFLIVPAGFILRMGINSEKALTGITTIKNNVMTTASAPIKTASFQMMAENQQASIWTKLVDAGPQWLPILWGVGVCAVAAYLLSIYLYFTRDIKMNSEYIHDDSIDKIQAEVLSKHKGKKPISIYQCARISSPMIVGIFKPAIFIPKRDYTMSDLQIILTHELTHYLRKDLLYKGLFIMALILHWYNPFVHLMTKAADKDMEMCCDWDVIKAKDQKFRADYSDVIMGEIISCRPIEGAMFACMGCDKKTMEERFKNIFSNKKRKGGILFLGVLAFVIVFNGFAYANDHNVPDFDSPGYQQLLEKVIADKADSDKENREEARIRNNREYQDIPNFDELANLVMDENGDYDLADVYELAGVKPPDDWSDLADLPQFQSHFTTVNNCIEPHILGNGDRAIYSTESGKQWKLKKGDIVKLHIFADINRFGEDSDPFGRKIAAKGVLKVGYIKDDKCVDIQEFKIDGEKQIEFKIPEDGSYNFYLFCPGSLDIIIKWVSIDIK